MKLVKVNPFGTIANFNTLANVVDEVMNRSLGEFVGNDTLASTPSVNIIENATTYRLEIAAPGVEKEDFKINIEKDQLVVAVEKKTENEKKEDERFVRREFSYKAFRRTFRLPENINIEAINARYENGILYLDLPKSEPQNLVKNISIN